MRAQGLLSPGGTWRVSSLPVSSFSLLPGGSLLRQIFLKCTSELHPAACGSGIKSRQPVWPSGSCPAHLETLCTLDPDHLAVPSRAVLHHALCLDRSSTLSASSGLVPFHSSRTHLRCCLPPEARLHLKLECTPLPCGRGYPLF